MGKLKYLTIFLVLFVSSAFAQSRPPSTNQLLQVLNDSPMVKECKLSLRSSAGAVTVSGTVATQETKSAIEQILKSQPGVRVVHNQLIVTGGGQAPSLSGEQLRTHIASALASEGINGVDVSVNGSDVTLSGSLPSFDLVDRALSVVMNVSDVGEVKSNILVSSKPYAGIEFKDSAGAVVTAK